MVITKNGFIPVTTWLTTWMPNHHKHWPCSTKVVFCHDGFTTVLDTKNDGLQKEAGVPPKTSQSVWSLLITLKGKSSLWFDPCTPVKINRLVTSNQLVGMLTKSNFCWYWFVVILVGGGICFQKIEVPKLKRIILIIFSVDHRIVGEIWLSSRRTDS